MSAAIVIALLFDCTPYRCRLSTIACAKRWHRANAPKPKLAPTTRRARPHADVDETVALCAGCAVGGEHAAQHPEVLPPITKSRKRKKARGVDAAVEQAQARKRLKEQDE